MDNFHPHGWNTYQLLNFINMNNSYLLILLLLFSLSVPATLNAEGQSDLVPDEWLLMGPVAGQDPVYSDVPGIDGSTWTVEQLLKTDMARYADWVPAEGSAIPWSRGQKLEWTRVSVDDEGVLPLAEGSDERHDVMWAALYLEADRFVTGSVTLESRGMLRVFLNGDKVTEKSTTQPGSDEAPGSTSHSFEMRRGKHLLLIKMIHPAESEISDWTLKASLESGEHSGSLSVSLDPARSVLQRDISNAPRPAGVSISPDGELAAIHIRQDLPPDGSSEAWIDIRKTSDGSLFRRYAGGMAVTGMQWVPEGRRFSYTTSGNNGTDLWIVDLDTGEKDRILKDMNDFTGYRWSPDASFVIFSLREEHKPGTDGVLRYHGLQDRRPDFHMRTFLYQLNVPEGTTRRLTAGLLSTMLGSIHPSGKEILYLRSHENYEERPYGKMEYVILDLETMETDSLFMLSFGGAAQYSPDGNRILVFGGPNDFGGLGANVQDTLIANDYDTQAYLYHRDTGETEAITRTFDPSVSMARWDETGRYIYFVVTEASYERVYRYDTRDRSFRSYEGGPDVVHSLDLARDRSVAVLRGSGASDTPKTWVIDFTRRNPQARLLYDPGADAYRNIRFGDVRNWTFVNDRGGTIDGHVYYPPDFDENRSYPVIVYYYGGASPVSRAYAGRYPKELYASKGYLVYVVQPSGATGYGQDFSAVHVNDWGKIAGDEIIQGTRAFLEAHPYANPERVGAIGASYGGFMTMYLLTQTDIFAAAVSHAGISNLASYWGEGFWGYQYSGVATAGSYPWNRHDIYVGRSPVFNADRIHTPLLLVTGMSDTNVPPGESLQMFAALKLLGRDVAFVAVEDQDHHILDYKKYIQWKDAILSWFDKWLKEEPHWWEVRFEG